MIARLLELAQPRVPASDGLITTDETLTVVMGPGGCELTRLEAVGAHLRVQESGRIGMAGREDLDFEALLEAALASLRFGEEGQVLLPAPAPLPEVLTALPAARSLGPADCQGLCRLLAERLERDHRHVTVWTERSVGRVDVGNSRGVLAGYDVTLVGIGATVRTGAAHAPLELRLHHAAADVPSPSDIERLVAEVDRRLTPPVREAPVAGGTFIVALAPRAVIALLTPLRQALLANELARGPLSGRLGERAFSPLFTVSDDPLVPGRPGSRPLDDEAVVARRITLIEAGVLRGGLANLDMGSRAGVPSTGHGVRTAGAPPQVGWSNFVVGAGDAGGEDLAAWAGDGLVVLDLPGPTGNLVDGRFALATPWAYQAERGEVTGRIERAVLRGNLYELLNRIGAVGNALEWTGAAAAPGMLLEGVEVSFG